MRTSFFLFAFFFFSFHIMPIVSAGNKLLYPFIICFAVFCRLCLFSSGTATLPMAQGGQTQERSTTGPAGDARGMQQGQPRKICGSSDPASQPCMPFVHHLAMFQ